MSYFYRLEVQNVNIRYLAKRMSHSTKKVIEKNNFISPTQEIQRQHKNNIHKKE